MRTAEGHVVRRWDLIPLSSDLPSPHSDNAEVVPPYKHEPRRIANLHMYCLILVGDAKRQRCPRRRYGSTDSPAHVDKNPAVRFEDDRHEPTYADHMSWGRRNMGLGAKGFPLVITKEQIRLVEQEISSAKPTQVLTDMAKQFTSSAYKHEQRARCRLHRQNPGRRSHAAQDEADEQQRALHIPGRGIQRTAYHTREHGSRRESGGRRLEQKVRYATRSTHGCRIASERSRELPSTRAHGRDKTASNIVSAQSKVSVAGELEDER
ncbi:hypothetical protein BJ912DRAFT_932921 [Pholiota molesta]|nr:hypothetical protein BJ912DRAFT_932921 [Pholiota molesta]